MDQNQRKMLAEIVSAKAWVTTPLAGFSIRKMTEVFGQGEDGLRRRSIGYFNNPKIAAAFAAQESGKEFCSCGTREAFVLTNGVVGFLLDESEPVYLFNDEKTALSRIGESILAKLDPKDRTILGL